jgi:hypothetical protein
MLTLAQAGLALQFIRGGRGIVKFPRFSVYRRRSQRLERAAEFAA